MSVVSLTTLSLAFSRAALFVVRSTLEWHLSQVNKTETKTFIESQKIVEEVQFCCVSKNLDLRHVPSIELHKVDRALV